MSGQRGHNVASPSARGGAPRPDGARSRSSLRFTQTWWRRRSVAIAAAVAVGTGLAVNSLMPAPSGAGKRMDLQDGGRPSFSAASGELLRSRFDPGARQDVHAAAVDAQAKVVLPNAGPAPRAPQRVDTPVPAERGYPGGNPQASGIAATDNGLSLANVRENSLFGLMGLQSGDVLMSVNGEAVGAQTDLTALLLPIMRGEPAAAYVLRDGQTFPMKLQFSPPLRLRQRQD